MAYEQRPNSGQLFKNNKRDKETQPNARGEAMIGGVLYEISAWTKRDKNGNPWQSLSFKPKEERAEPAWGSDLPRGKPSAPAGDFDDDLSEIPF